MKCLILTVMFFLTASSALADDWFCKDEGSIRQGSSILTCGVGTASTEEDARMRSLINAKNEFKQLCISSADCKFHKIAIDPKRMTCSQVLNQYKCYRLIVFIIGEKLEKSEIEQAYMAAAPVWQPPKADPFDLIKQ